MLKLVLALAGFCSVGLGGYPFLGAAVAAGQSKQAMPAEQDVAKPLSLVDGDRVVFVGGTFIEREGQTGYIEAALTAAFADRRITFRNLGQSGDTVLADARNLNSGWAAFGPAEQGFQRLSKLIGEIKPTCIVANYGMTESFEGPARLGEFVGQYERLLDMMVRQADPNVRLILVSPNFHETQPATYPDARGHNDSLRQYRDAIREVAAKRSHRFVDLYAVTEQLAAEHLNPNGIHPSSAGFAKLAPALLKALGVDAPKGIDGPDFDRLRRLVVQKNAEYFNYWRPQNDTYILGYRQKEQGRNAAELPRFLELVEVKEKQIAAAKRPWQGTER